MYLYDVRVIARKDVNLHVSFGIHVSSSHFLRPEFTFVTCTTRAVSSYNLGKEWCAQLSQKKSRDAIEKDPTR